MCGASCCGTGVNAAPGPRACNLLDYATEHALRSLIHRSTRLQDTGNVEQLALLFRRGEIVFAGVGEVFSGTDGVRALMRRHLFYDANGNPANPELLYATGRALHYVSNIDIFRGEDGVLGAESQFLIVQQHGNSPPQIIIGGRYRDSFGQADEGFYFHRRIVEVHFIGETGAYLNAHPWGDLSRTARR
jgi:SnoaL-like domain